MPTIHFDEEWLREYTRRTGKGARGEASRPPEEKPKRRKYGNVRTQYAGRVFDSKHEAEVFAQIELRIRAGELVAVACQVPFQVAAQVRYVADFVALRNDGGFDVIDAKSEATRRDKVFLIKKKLMRERFGIEILEV